MSSGPKSLAQLTNSNHLDGSAKPFKSNTPAPISDKDAEVVGRLLERLKLVFPAWKRSFPTELAERRAGQEWTRALIDADCTSPEQLSRGMAQARLKVIPFFPSPGMFIEWCKVTPESVGMPSLDQALHEIARHRISHPAVKLAAMRTSFERGTLSASEYRPVFEYAYEEMVRRVMAGEDLEAHIKKALPTKDQIQHSHEYYKEAGLKGLALVKAQLGRRA